MSRTIVSAGELINWINTELAKHDECKGCHIRSVITLAGEDQEGCNWSSPILGCSGVPADVCELAASHVIQRARDKFNIK